MGRQRVRHSLNNLVKGVGVMFLVRWPDRRLGFWNLNPRVEEILVCAGMVLDEFVCRMIVLGSDPKVLNFVGCRGLNLAALLIVSLISGIF